MSQVVSSVRQLRPEDLEKNRTENPNPFASLSQEDRKRLNTSLTSLLEVLDAGIEVVNRRRQKREDAQSQ